jgi:hypothetical protein
MARGKIREPTGMPAIIMGDGRLREFQWGGVGKIVCAIDSAWASRMSDFA